MNKQVKREQWKASVEFSSSSLKQGVQRRGLTSISLFFQFDTSFSVWWVSSFFLGGVYKHSLGYLFVAAKFHYKLIFFTTMFWAFLLDCSNNKDNLLSGIQMEVICLQLFIYCLFSFHVNKTYAVKFCQGICLKGMRITLIIRWTL